MSYSALFSPFPFLFWFLSLAVNFKLFTLLCLHFAVESSLLNASSLLFAVLYSLLTSRASVLCSQCLIMISLSSTHAASWLLNIIWSMLLVIPKLAAHSCCSLIAVRKQWIVAPCSHCITRFSPPPPPSVAVECMVFAYVARFLLATGNCLPLTLFSLMLVVSSKRSDVFLSHIAFRCTVLCFALLSAWLLPSFFSNFACPSSLLVNQNLCCFTI